MIKSDLRFAQKNEVQMKFFNRLALCSIICAILTIGVAFTYEDSTLLFRVAASLGALAYFLVLLDNYARSAPLPMKTGSLDKKDAPLRYRIVYIGFVFAGLIALLVIWTAE